MAIARSIQTGADVVTYLKHQHEHIRILTEEVMETEGEERLEAFSKLRRLLAVHETAEEEIVHPIARRALANGEAVVATRLREENQAKKVLAGFEKLEVDTPEFDRKFHALKKDVIAHAESEEAYEFRLLSQSMRPETLKRMRAAAEFAESVAPTHPHPGMESATANLLAGPFAAMLDRSRDLLSPKH